MASNTHTARNSRAVHARWLRLLHWLNAIAVTGLVSSGWAIYNASPFYPIEFPSWLTLGGYLTNALRWHFALMWVVAGATVLLVGLRLLGGAGGPRLLPVSLVGARRDLVQAARIRLVHEYGVYNQLQRLTYIALFAVLVLAVLSGLALWKPVQFDGLSALLGGYETARRVHFWTMAGICAFVVVHVMMVIATPRTLLSMLFGARLTVPSSTP